ncbi:hypothetical protein B0A55_13390 [Friedmanniomyces simplex]|uniref:Phenol hydroxylase-like C-terminal dimerisation domain-containing protein n=1 Tax=Friedmanniomyces simplex TaxID=329884 RepID=A0A4U0V771_9PEZI|nr:hypothetical protein B0A55_13390 [Friedmanniomyces simplex]
MVLLDEVLGAQRDFTNGLGISYPPNLVNDVDGSDPLISTVPGHHFRDTEIYRNGDTRNAIRLHEVTKYNGKFRILVFAGVAAHTRSALRSLRAAVDRQAPRFQHAVDFLTIIAGTGRAFEEHLGVPQFGKAYWDIDLGAHTCYGVDTESGAMAVLRPDGLLGHVASLDGFDRVMRYLERLVVPRETKATTNGHATGKELGDVFIENENNLAMPEEDGPESKEAGVVVQ